MDRPVFLFHIPGRIRAVVLAASYRMVFVLLVEELVREIEQHQCLRALCLEGNTVGVDAAWAIAKALESKDMLQVLIGLIFIFSRPKTLVVGIFHSKYKIIKSFNSHKPI